jgi:SAM-dependent methyltransferase
VPSNSGGAIHARRGSYSNRVSSEDRRRWDERYAGAAPESAAAAGPPAVFAAHADEFPSAGTALELACGRGAGAVWLARRGLAVLGVDVSPVAITAARELAGRNGVGDRCRFDVVDLDDGLPPGPAADAIVCHRFRDRGLYPQISERLAPGGLLAIAVLSEVGAGAGPFRAAAGELTGAFADLDVIAGGEDAGLAWLLARAGRTPRD